MIDAGAFGHITSAIVCAASSFSMSITSPAGFLKELDSGFFQQYRQLPSFDLAPIDYSEPDLLSNLTFKSPQEKKLENGEAEPPKQLEKISSKVIVLPDFVDTDAVRDHSPFTGFALTIASWRQDQRSRLVQRMKSLDNMYSNIPIQTFGKRCETDSR